MKKPDGYDAAQAATGEYEILQAGGHVCIIKQAKVDKTATDKEVIILVFDIYEGEYKEYYKRNFDRRKENNPEAKWQGTFRQLTEGKSLPFFKGMIDAIEKSNPNYKWNWDETTLKGKLFGGIFGEEEYEGNDGKTHASVKCRFVRTVEAVKTGKFSMPEKKLSSSNDGHVQNFGQSSYEPVGEDDELPF
jgi:hypothetical protein